MGLVAGVFGLCAHPIMPGLGKTDDRIFVGAFQAIDRSTCRSTTAQGGRGSRPHRRPGRGPCEVQEARWTSWNLVRVLMSTTAFGLLAWALILHGRST
jgi:hypothetical protein